MSKWPLKLESISVTKVMLVVSASPGITTAQIAERTGFTVSYVRKVQFTASEVGWMGCVPLDGVEGGRGRGWYVAKDLDAARSEWDEKAKRRLLERGKKGLAKMKAKQPAMKGAQPVHRMIGAKSKKPLPFKVNAPNSIFAMGGG